MTYSRSKVAPVAAAAILALSLTTAFAADDAPAADPAATEQPAADAAAPADDPAAAPAAEEAPASPDAAATDGGADAAASDAAPAADAPAEAPADAAASPATEEAAPAGTAEAPAAPAASTELSADDLAIGTPVMASDGVQIGEINRVTSDASGKVSEIHVTAGGPAGLGAKVVAIPASMITAGGKPVKVSISAADAKKLPILDDGQG
ncbi:MAG: PRC-barrel domain-containing protein [Hyphomicrobiaceae bacterium]